MPGVRHRVGAEGFQGTRAGLLSGSGVLTRRKETLGVALKGALALPHLWSPRSRDATLGEALLPMVLPPERQGERIVCVFSPGTGCSGRKLGNMPHLWKCIQ